MKSEREWRKPSEEEVKEITDPVRPSKAKDLPDYMSFSEQVKLALFRWDKFRIGPLFWGKSSVPSVLESPTETRKLVAARKALKHEYRVTPIDLRLLTIMDTAYASEPKDNNGVTLEKIKEFFEERLEIRIRGDWPKRLLDPLKKLCWRKPKHKRLARLKVDSNGEKYNVLTKRGSFFLKATFPPWDKAGFKHRRKTKDAKYCVEQVGCYGYPVFHGEKEVEYSQAKMRDIQSSHAQHVPRSHEPDLIIFYPENPREYSRLDWAGGTTEWSDDVLHGEIIRDVIQTSKMVKRALRKNTGLGRRTVFFVNSWKEARKIRQESLEYLKDEGLPEIIGAGIRNIPKNCLVVLQPIKSRTPTKSEKREMKEEETIKKIGEALATGGKVRKHRKGNKVYVEIRKPGESKFHGEGHVSKRTWREIKEWRDSPFLDQYPPRRVEKIKENWRRRMKKAIEIELDKRKERRTIEIGQTMIKIGQLKFEKTDESENYLRRLMKRKV